MLKAFYASATGMRAQELMIDNTANNLANVNTTGFKRKHINFADLLYDTTQPPGATTLNAGFKPIGLQIGSGVRAVGTTSLFSQGTPTETGISTHMAIEGDGFFRVIQGNQIAYTRDGSFTTNDQGQLVTAEGFFLDPQNPAHQPPRFQFRQVEGSPDEVDLEFVVQEGRVVDFQLSGGIASDSGLVGLLSVSHSNFDTGVPPTGFLSAPGEVYRKEALHGNGEFVAFDISPGNEVSYWRVAYRHPDLFADHFDRWGGAFDATNRLRLFRSHREQRRRVRLEASRAFAQGDLTWRFGVIWQDLEVSNLAGGLLPSTLLDSTDPARFQGLTTRLSWNQLDNARFPREGTYAYGEFSVFGGPLGGNQKQVAVDLRAERYIEMDWRDEDLDPVLLVQGNLGLAAPFGDTKLTHYGERFFLGGARRMRGFDFRGVGPFEGPYPVGGESMLYLSSELRWPLFTSEIPGSSARRELFRGGPFIDLGVLDPDAWSLDFDEMRASWGFTFALVQPLPIVFNLGWPLREGPGDDLQVFTFSLASR